MILVNMKEIWSNNEGMQAQSYWPSKHRGFGSGSVTPSCFLCLWVILTFLNIIKCRENNERIKVAIEAAKHMNIHTPPTVRGSKVCISQLVCPTWVSSGWLRWPVPSPPPWVTYLVNRWRCNLCSSMQLHHVRDRISVDKENALFGVMFYCILLCTMLELK